jgi:hypothetical protein
VEKIPCLLFFYYCQKGIIPSLNGLEWL